jgi:FixJ family two-component response regulator
MTAIIHTSGHVTPAPAVNGSAIYLLVDVATDCWDVPTRQVLQTLATNVVSFASADDYFRFSRRDGVACLILCLLAEESLEIQRRNLRADGPPVIFVSSRFDIESTVKAVKAGAVECLSSPLSPAALTRAIQLAFEQDARLRQQRGRVASVRQRFSKLTPRQQEVFPLVISGLKNKEAAWRLGIAEVTLQVHRGQIMRRMGAPSFAELVRMGDELGLDANVPLVRGPESQLDGTPPRATRWPRRSDLASEHAREKR